MNKKPNLYTKKWIKLIRNYNSRLGYTVYWNKKCKSITKILYLNSQKNTLEGDILNLIPNEEYGIDWSVLRSDLGHSSEKVNSVILNGTNIGGCNPPGKDHDCDFYDCTDSFIRKIKADENGKINVKANYQGHSSDCYCDQKVGKCISEKKSKPTGYVSTFAAIKFNLYFCDNGKADKHLKEADKHLKETYKTVTIYIEVSNDTYADGSSPRFEFFDKNSNPISLLPGQTNKFNPDRLAKINLTHILIS